jgi:hypothetical protein
MSSHGIHEVIGTAIIDRAFCRALLEGDRETLLAAFDLSPEERRVLLDIQADSLQGFAQRVYDWETRPSQQPVTLWSSRSGVPAQRDAALWAAQPASYRPTT